MRIYEFASFVFLESGDHETNNYLGPLPYCNKTNKNNNGVFQQKPAKKEFIIDIYKYRIQAVLMRQRFEENRHIKDPIKAKKVVEEAEEKFEKIRHPDPLIFPDSHRAPAWDRIDVAKSPDVVLDYWHPLEKAQYPDYFARREQRKKEFVEWYDKTYGRPPYERYD